MSAKQIITDKKALDFLKKIMWERVFEIDKEVASLIQIKIKPIKLIKKVEKTRQYEQ